MGHRLHSRWHVEEVCYQAIRRALFPVGRRAVRKDAKRYMRAFLDTTEKLEKENAAALFKRIERKAFAGMAVSPLKVGKA